MNTILKCLLFLILLADVLLLLAIVTAWIFGFSLGVRIPAETVVMREVTRMELMTVLAITFIVAFAALVLLRKLRTG